MDDDGQAARLIAEAEQQLRMPELQARLMTALEHEQFTGPVHAAHWAGERAYQMARAQAERAGMTAEEEIHARGKRAFWVAYFTDLAAEATVRAESARAELKRCGDE